MRAKRFYRKERREHTENCFFNHGWNRMGTEFTENGGSKTWGKKIFTTENAALLTSFYTSKQSERRGR